MIDLEKKMGQHGRTRKRVRELINDSISHYDNSDCKKRLKSRVDRLRDSAMLKFRGFGNGANKYLSIAIPAVKEQMLTTRASIRANFRSQQFWTVSAEDNADKQAAQNVEMLIAQNTRATQWLSKSWTTHVESLIKYGSSVNYCAPVAKFERDRIPVVDPFFGVTYQERERETITAYNSAIDVRNYGQDPGVCDADDSPYQFHRERVHISEFKRRILSAVEKAEFGATNPWDMPLVKKKLEQLKDGLNSDKFYSGNTVSGKNKHYYDIVHWFGVIPIEGNEDSPHVYYVVLLDGEILRFQEMRFAMQGSQYNILRTDQHDLYWWGSPQAEYRVPHENFLNMHVNATYDQLMKSMKQYVFYDKNSGIPENLQQIMPWGGMVPVDSQADRRVSDIFHAWQPNPVDLNSSNAVTALVEQQMRNTSSKPEFTQPGGQRAVAANTATGVQALEHQGDMMQSDYLEQISHALEAIGTTDYRMLKEVLPPHFTVTAPQRGTMQLSLVEIMGSMRFQVHSALTRSRRSELVRYQNALTWFMNMAGTGHPMFQATNIEPIYKEIWRLLDVGDVGEIVPDQPPQPQQQLPAPQQPQPVNQGVAPNVQQQVAA